MHGVITITVHCPEVRVRTEWVSPAVLASREWGIRKGNLWGGSGVREPAQALRSPSLQRTHRAVVLRVGPRGSWAMAAAQRPDQYWQNRSLSWPGAACCETGRRALRIAENQTQTGTVLSWSNWRDDSSMWQWLKAPIIPKIVFWNKCVIAQKKEKKKDKKRWRGVGRRVTNCDKYCH